MSRLDPLVTAAFAAHDAGRFDEAMRLLTQLFADEDDVAITTGSRFFETMLGWRMLLADYPPARAALQALRDEQVRRLLAGDLAFGLARGPVYRDGGRSHATRFSVIVKINGLIADPASTAALFARLHATDPLLARKYAWQALPAVVATGAFALADGYRGDPLAQLAEVNAEALMYPLFPVAREAPRLAAGLANLVGDVAIGIAVLAGLGRADEARALHAALLDGLKDDAVRALAQRELAAPGTIMRALGEHDMAVDRLVPPA